MIWLIIYFVAAYWAAGVTIYADKIRIGSAYNLFITRFIVSMFLGWLFIPWAIIKLIFSK